MFPWRGVLVLQFFGSNSSPLGLKNTLNLIKYPFLGFKKPQFWAKFAVKIPVLSQRYFHVWNVLHTLGRHFKDHISVYFTTQQLNKKHFRTLPVVNYNEELAMKVQNNILTIISSRLNKI